MRNVETPIGSAQAVGLPQGAAYALAGQDGQEANADSTAAWYTALEGERDYAHPSGETRSYRAGA
jgi:hypothetical protein